MMNPEVRDGPLESDIKRIYSYAHERAVALGARTEEAEDVAQNVIISLIERTGGRSKGFFAEIDRRPRHYLAVFDGIVITSSLLLLLPLIVGRGALVALFGPTETALLIGSFAVFLLSIALQRNGSYMPRCRRVKRGSWSSEISEAGSRRQYFDKDRRGSFLELRRHLAAFKEVGQSFGYYLAWIAHSSLLLWMNDRGYATISDTMWVMAALIFALPLTLLTGDLYRPFTAERLFHVSWSKKLTTWLALRAAHGFPELRLSRRSINTIKTQSNSLPPCLSEQSGSTPDPTAVCDAARTGLFPEPGVASDDNEDQFWIDFEASEVRNLIDLTDLGTASSPSLDMHVDDTGEDHAGDDEFWDAFDDLRANRYMEIPCRRLPDLDFEPTFEEIAARYFEDTMTSPSHIPAWVEDLTEGLPEKFRSHISKQSTTEQASTAERFPSFVFLSHQPEGVGKSGLLAALSYLREVHHESTPFILGDDDSPENRSCIQLQLAYAIPTLAHTSKRFLLEIDGRSVEQEATLGCSFYVSLWYPAFAPSENSQPHGGSRYEEILNYLGRIHIERSNPTWSPMVMDGIASLFDDPFRYYLNGLDVSPISEWSEPVSRPLRPVTSSTVDSIHWAAPSSDVESQSKNLALPGTAFGEDIKGDLVISRAAKPSRSIVIVTSPPTSLQVISGQGGSGKSRLAAGLLRPDVGVQNSDRAENLTSETLQTTGRRKQAIARVRLTPGSGKIMANGRDFDDYFPSAVHRTLITEPLRLTDREEDFDIAVTLSGGALSGQAGAFRLGISRALVELDPAVRPAIKAAGLLTRDPRKKESKKYGRKKARKAAQYSKR